GRRHIRRLFRRRRKTPAKNDNLQQKARPTAGPLIKKLAAAPGLHLCTAICQSISSLPPEYHEYVISQLAHRLGVTPEKLVNEGLLFLSNARTVPGQEHDVALGS